MDRSDVYVEATPEAVWDVVSDLAGMGRFSPENTGGRWTSGSPGAVGSTFAGTNRHGLVRWTTRCTVVEVEEGRRFAFQAEEPKARWTFLVEPAGTGTLLTETREIYARPALHVRLVSGSGILGRHREHIVRAGMNTTLARMKAYLER